MAGKSTIRWMSDFSNKFVINASFQRRGWQEVETEAEADIYWASINSVKGLFAAESLAQLRPTQLVNHFPNHYELTRKDLLAKNIKRYQRLTAKSGVTPPNIIPSTFVLPQVMHKPHKATCTAPVTHHIAGVLSCCVSCTRCCHLFHGWAPR